MAAVIIGVAGYAGAGKDTAAQHLVERHGFVRRAFADKLREVADLMGDRYMLPLASHDQAYNAYLRECGGYEQAKRSDPAVRNYLVRIGHGLRRILGDSLWLDQVLGGGGLPQRLVISDVRYENEAQAVIDRNGYVVWVDREGVGPANETERENGRKVAALCSHFFNNVEGKPEVLQRCMDSVVEEAAGLPPLPKCT